MAVGFGGWFGLSCEFRKRPLSLKVASTKRTATIATTVASHIFLPPISVAPTKFIRVRTTFGMAISAKRPAAIRLRHLRTIRPSKVYAIPSAITAGSNQKPTATCRSPITIKLIEPSFVVRKASSRVSIFAKRLSFFLGGLDVMCWLILPNVG